MKTGIQLCSCKRHYSQPECNWRWDSHRECYFFGYHLYLYVASNSAHDLPVFPMLERTCRHDTLSALYAFFTTKSYIPQIHIEKLLMDPAYDAYAVYNYCQRRGIVPFQTWTIHGKCLLQRPFKNSCPAKLPDNSIVYIIKNAVPAMPSFLRHFFIYPPQPSWVVFTFQGTIITAQISEKL